jgi:hypothetical protein
VTHLLAILLHAFLPFDCKLAQMIRCRYDFHDYGDEKDEQLRYPWHFHTFTCRRCGAKFGI